MKKKRKTKSDDAEIIGYRFCRYIRNHWTGKIEYPKKGKFFKIPIKAKEDNSQAA